jgi:hypothetical protein
MEETITNAAAVNRQPMRRFGGRPTPSSASSAVAAAAGAGGGADGGWTLCEPVVTSWENDEFFARAAIPA